MSNRRNRRVAGAYLIHKQKDRTIWCPDKKLAKRLSPNSVWRRMTLKELEKFGLDHQGVNGELTSTTKVLEVPKNLYEMDLDDCTSFAKKEGLVDIFPDLTPDEAQDYLESLIKAENIKRGHSADGKDIVPPEFFELSKLEAQEHVEQLTGVKYSFAQYPKKVDYLRFLVDKLLEFKQQNPEEYDKVIGEVVVKEETKPSKKVEPSADQEEEFDVATAELGNLKKLNQMVEYAEYHGIDLSSLGDKPKFAQVKKFIKEYSEKKDDELTEI